MPRNHQSKNTNHHRFEQTAREAGGIFFCCLRRACTQRNSNKKTAELFSSAVCSFGRDDWIRTSDNTPPRIKIHF